MDELSSAAQRLIEAAMAEDKPAPERVQESWAEVSTRITQAPPDLASSDFDASLTQGGESTIAVGVQVGRYRIVAPLGQGAMGSVWTAVDPELDREVALKVVHPRYARRGGERAKQRLLTEARAMAQLSHPNVVGIYDVGEFDDQIYLAMELVPGVDLAQWLRAEPRTWRNVIAVFRDAGRGLAAAHEHGLIHRDFKPANVLVGDDGRVRVGDFGLAQAPSTDLGGIAEVHEAGPTSNAARSQLTRDGTVVGTPAYMPPEQHHGHELTPKCDQYAFCVSLHEGIYRARPFTGGSDRALLRAKITGPLRPPNAIGPPRLWSLIAQGLHPDPARRHPSVARLADALDDLIAGRRSKRRWWWASLGLVAVLLSGIGLLPAKDASRCHAPGSAWDGVWDEANTARVRASLHRPTASAASDEVERTVALLDEYRDAWLHAQRRACTLPRGNDADTQRFDHAMTCLELRLHNADAVISVLEDASATVAGQATELAGGLPAVQSCLDLEAAPYPAPPEHEAARTAVAKLRETISRARALLQAGQYPDGLALAEQATKRAEQLGYPPALAEALLVRGELQETMGQVEQARATLERAYYVAESVSHDRAATDAASVMLWLASERLGDLDLGRRWAAITRSSLDRLGPDPYRRAMLLMRLGVLEYAAADYGRAQELYGEALTLVAPLESREARTLPVALMANSGNALLASREYAEATRAYRTAIERCDAVRGAEHPTCATLHDLLGLALAGSGQHEEAVARHRYALRTLEQTLGSDHPDLALTLINLGNAYEGTGQGEQALQTQLRALRILEQLPPSRNTSALHNNLGGHYQDRGLFELAAEHFRKSVDIAERIGGANHFDVIFPLSGLGSAHAKLGNLDTAQTYLERALEVAEAYPEEERSLAVVLSRLSDVARERGDLQTAEGLVRDALNRFVALQAGADRDIALTLYRLTWILVEQGREDEALEVIEARRPQSTDVRATTTAIVDVAVALALQARGRERARVEALARNALQELQTSPIEYADPIQAASRLLSGAPVRTDR